MKNLLLTLLLITTGFLAKASFMAGEIGWTQIGQDSFLIEAKLYRDCNEEEFKQKLLSVNYAKSGALAKKIILEQVATKDVTPVCKHCCTRCDNLSCSFPFGFQECIYQGVLVIQRLPTECEIILRVDDLFFNKNIMTLKEGQAAVLESRINICLKSKVNSPDFQSLPTQIFCIRRDIEVDLACSNEKEYDSIVYSMKEIPANTGHPISYSDNYSYSKPIYYWGFPDQYPFPRGFVLHAQSQKLRFRPMKIQTTVFMVEASVYRGATRLGLVNRIFQFIVLSCPNNNPPVLSGPYYKEVCGGDTAKFIIHSNDYDSKDTLRLTLNNKIAGVHWSDNNNQTKHPTGTFLWATTTTDISTIPYSFSVSVVDDACTMEATSSRAYQILVKKCGSTDIEVDFIRDFLIYPNPATTYLYIQSYHLDLSIGEIELFSVSGDRLYHVTDLHEKWHRINIEKLNKGTYIVKVTPLIGKHRIQTIQIYR